MVAKLIAEEGLLKGLVLALEEGDAWVIGRDPEECQLVLEDPSTSRRHAECRLTAQGVTIENLSESNPATVNDEEIKEPKLLRHGDAVKIGSAVFRFYTDTEAHVEDLEVKNGHHSILAEHDEVADMPSAQVDFGTHETGRFMLKVVAGPNMGAEFGMQPGTSYLIGTDPGSCDIVFHDVSVSRQHAKLSVGADNSVTLEDLKSRNSTIVDEKKLEGKQVLAENALVTMGTTTFVILDREAERQTIFTPFLPSIAKILKEEDAKKAAPVAVEVPVVAPPQKQRHSLGSLVILAIVGAILVVVGIGTAALFRTHDIVNEKVDEVAALNEILTPFPAVKYSYNKATGQLLLVGHVLNTGNQTQLLYNLRALPFIKNIDSNVVVDELVWQEFNQVLAKNPAWRGITMHSPSPGNFIITGYLQTKQQAEQLRDYINQNFRYLDLLERRVVVEEDLSGTIAAFLEEKGLREIKAQISNGEVTFTGVVSTDKSKILATLLEQVRAIPGIRVVRNLVTELTSSETVINITTRYEITGYSQRGSSLTVIINGRILSKGDILDGMTITNIQPTAVSLEKDSIKYRIDYNK